MHKKNRISYAQAQLPFQGTGTRTVAVPFARERKTLTYLAGVGAVLAVLYGAFVGASVAHVAGREAAVKEARVLSAAVAELEGTYLAETRGITEEYARSLGYVPALNRVFVTRTVSYAGDASR